MKTEKQHIKLMRYSKSKFKREFCSDKYPRVRKKKDLKLVT